VTLNILGKGELFEMAALDEAPRSTDVITHHHRNWHTAQDFVQLIQTEPLAGVSTIVSVDGAAIAASKSAIAAASDSMLRVADTLLFWQRDREYRAKQECKFPTPP